MEVAVIEHTKEPWGQAYRKGFDGMYRQQVFDATGNTIATLAWHPVKIDDRTTTTNREANARRIVACVNACAGYSNEALEEPGGFMKTLGVALDAQKLAEQQRDELLALVNGFHRKLETYRNVYSGDKELRRLLSECEAAIAKVKL